jgi:glycosyltransferase involved in cell wall biosynthesis
MAEPRIAFIRMADFPYPNRLLPEALAEELGRDHVAVFDVEAAVRRDPFVVGVNLLFMALEHWLNLLTRRVRPWRAFFTTTWMFRQMSRKARHFIERGGFDASIQIQSLFDAHAPGVPHLVYTDHTHLANLVYPHFDRRTLLGGKWLSLETRAYQSASRVLTRSRNIDRSLVDDYGCEPERVVHVGAGANVDSHVEVVGPSVRRQPPRILFVGMDWERKGGPELVRAFEQLAIEQPDLELAIVGCEPPIRVPGIEVVGRLGREAMPREYERASIFCLPTRREPYGVAFVEAMHFGLPVVATRVGAVPEIVAEGETGLLVEPGDVAELTAALGKLASDPALRADMGRRALERARREFTWKAVAEKVLLHVDESIAERADVEAEAGRAWMERESGR